MSTRKTQKSLVIYSNQNEYVMKSQSILRWALVIITLAFSSHGKSTSLSDGIFAMQQGRFSEAASLLQPYASQGMPEAQRILGEMYFEGKGVVVNKSIAIEWLRRAADAGDKIAQYDLGYIFQTGSGVLQSEQAAQGWYTKSAMQGYVPAQVKLGDLLVNTSKTAALQWYEMAAFAGNKYAADLASRIGAELNEVYTAKIAREMREEREHIEREDRRHKDALEKEERDAQLERVMESSTPPAMPASGSLDGLARINQITQDTLRQINLRATSPVTIKNQDRRNSPPRSEANETNASHPPVDGGRNSYASATIANHDASIHAPKVQRIVRSWGIQAFGKDVDEACRNVKAKQGSSGNVPMGFVRILKSEPCDCEKAQRHINGATIPASCKIAQEVEVEVEGGAAGGQSGPSSNTAR